MPASGQRQNLRTSIWRCLLTLTMLQEGLMRPSALGAAQLLPRAWLQLLRMLLHAGVPAATLRELTLHQGPRWAWLSHHACMLLCVALRS